MAETIGAILDAIVKFGIVLVAQLVTIGLVVYQVYERRKGARHAFLLERRTMTYEDVWNILNKKAHEPLKSRLPNVEIQAASTKEERLRTYLQQYPHFYISREVHGTLSAFAEDDSENLLKKEPRLKEFLEKKLSEEILAVELKA